VTSASGPTATAAFDLWEWKAGIEELLPDGLAMIRPDGAAPTARWVVEVHWVDQANKRSADVDLDEINAPDGATPTWDEVVSVRIALLVEPQTTVLDSDDNADYELPDRTVAASGGP
jgi:hypothetical protein